MVAIGVGDFERDFSLPWQPLELETLKETLDRHVTVGVGDFESDLSLPWQLLELETL